MQKSCSCDRPEKAESECRAPSFALFPSLRTMIRDTIWILIIVFCSKAELQPQQQPSAAGSSMISQPWDTGTPHRQHVSHKATELQDAQGCH